MRSSFTTALVLTLALVLAAPPARAGAPTDQLKTQVDRVLKLMDDPALKDKPKDKRAAVRRVADDSPAARALAPIARATLRP